LSNLSRLLSLFAPLLPHYPYTTLFRSAADAVEHQPDMAEDRIEGLRRQLEVFEHLAQLFQRFLGLRIAARDLFEHTLSGLVGLRSEEHTSELQSREKLVCRLRLDR